MREQSRQEKEKEQLIVRQEDSYKRQRKLERELEELKDERVKLITRISELDHLSTKLGDTNEKISTQGEKELASVTSRYEGQIRDLSSKLENVSEAHSKTCRDMQQLLADQRRMGEKWYSCIHHDELV